jgi:uncharacterized protein YndB with AHSA1/START domain
MTDGTIEQRGDMVIFRYERDLRHPIEVVWQSITDPEEIERWMGTRPEIDLQPGGRYISHHGTGDTVVDRVVRLEPPRLFEHTFWVHVNPTALVTWELTPTDDGCRLVLTHILSMDDVRYTAESVARGDSIALILSRNAAGWHQLLDKLEAKLEGHDAPWSDESHRALLDKYAALLG